MNAVNLIPVERRRAGARSAPGVPFLGLVVGLLMALLGTFLFFETHNVVSTKRSELAQVQAGTAQWSAAAARYAPYVSAAAQRRKQLGDLGGLLQERYDWSELLGQIAGVMPAQSALASVAAVQAPAGGSAAAAAAASGATTTNPGIQLSACAVSQSVVANTMVALRRMSGVSEVTLLSSTRTGGSGSSSAAGAGGAGNCTLPVQFSLTIAFVPPASTVTIPEGAAVKSATTASTTTTNSGTTGAAQ